MSGVNAYRPDIDGLRAIAVLSVVGYHAFPRSVPGGFTGVDVFFVISGFLISGLIYHDIDARRFTFARFYARRFRRIFPALIVVLAASLAYGWFALAPDEFRELGKQAAAGAGFLSNVLQWLQSGYFDQQATAKPLLHLWSLGVEEQFYIAWPIILVALHGRAPRLLLICNLIIVASFITCIVMTGSDRSGAFFLPMSRFWELLLGALLAALADDRPRRSGTGALAWTGLALLAAGFALIGPDRAFPGWWALLPTLGTVCLLAVPESWLNRKVLSARPLVWVGLISYPLYLWHWVILTFARIANDGQEISKAWRLSAIAAAFALAWLTYRLVEKPIRFARRRDAIPWGLVSVMGATAAVALVVCLSDGAAFRYPTQMRALAAFDYGRERNFHERAYRDGICFMSAKQTFADIRPACIDAATPGEPPGGVPLVVLWGDSHAASLYPGLLAYQRAHVFRIAQFTASGCPPLVALSSEHRDNCRSFNEAVLRELHSLHADTVIIEGHWALYAGINGLPTFEPAALHATVAAIAAAGVPRIIVMGSLPTWKIYQPRVEFKLWRANGGAMPERTREYLDPAPARIDGEVRAALRGTTAQFVAPRELLCDSGGCLISADATAPVPVAWDNDHLSVAGSSLLVQRLFAASSSDGGVPST